MAKKVIPRIEAVIYKTEKKGLFALFFLIVFPVFLVGCFSYWTSHRNMTESVYSRRQSLALLSSMVLKEKFDHLTNIGLSLATRVKFTQLVNEGRWDEAGAILKGTPATFPFIDRVFLTDVEGTETAAAPELSGVIGKNFAHRDWYKGVSAEWKPYVSEIYTRAAEPRLTVVAVAVPIKTAADQKVVGILVLQVALDVFFEWAKQMDKDNNILFYFVDKNGNVAGHPQHFDRIVNFSKVPVVEKILKGSREGIMVQYNPIDREQKLAAYASVPSYGWGAVVTEREATAFEPRNKQLRLVLLVNALFLLISCLLAGLILRALNASSESKKEISQLNDDLERRAVELQTANIELEAFSYSVSHDLRAPLRHIDGFIDLVRKNTSLSKDETLGRYLNIISDSARQMGCLIDDLLVFSRMGRAQMDKSSVDMNQLVTEAISALADETKDRKIDWIVHPLPSVRGDRSMLMLVFANLIGNAVKYSRNVPQARIEIGCSGNGTHAEFYVKDNGAGFEMLYVDKLFGVFQRLHSSEEYEGTGIGLANVKRIVSRHGGIVRAEGAVGLGATFYFSIPTNK